jgi:SAM-dependent methyltransferase
VGSAVTALAVARRTFSACPVCLTGDQRPYVAFESLAFVECGGCATLYKSFEESDVRPDDFYEAGYFHGRPSGRDRRFEHRVKKAQRRINAALGHGPARSVLDVGCSFGYGVEAGRRMGLDSYGVDVSRYAVDTCVKRGLQVRQGTLEGLPFDSGMFDLVTLQHVLEHTPEPRTALAELSRVTAPGAMLVIAVPHAGYWKGRYLRRSYRYFRPDDLGAQHYVYYQETNLRLLLEGCGFDLLAERKGAFRPRRAQGLGWLSESARSLATGAGLGLARAVGMQRELFVIARKG